MIHTRVYAFNSSTMDAYLLCTLIILLSNVACSSRVPANDPQAINDIVHKAADDNESPDSPAGGAKLKQEDYAKSHTDNPKLQRIDFENFGASKRLSEYLNEIFTQSYFLHGFIASFLVIVVSELGDKTFFIAAIMAMKHPRLTILSGAILALAVMTILAALLGHIMSIIPRNITFYTSSVLLLIFGVRMLFEAHGMSDAEGTEEMEEVQAELKRKDEEQDADYMESGGTRRRAGGQRSLFLTFFSPIFIQAFTLTFLAEWGDRSQLATIILAARENVLAVIVGGVIGHFLCTSIAVLGGRMIAQRISIKAVTYVGAFVFLGFGLSAFYVGP